MKRKTLFITLWVLVFICFGLANITNAQNESTFEKTGDAIQILIPATAYAVTYVLDDKEGRKKPVL